MLTAVQLSRNKGGIHPNRTSSIQHHPRSHHSPHKCKGEPPISITCPSPPSPDDDTPPAAAPSPHRRPAISAPPGPPSSSSPAAPPAPSRPPSRSSCPLPRDLRSSVSTRRRRRRPGRSSSAWSPPSPAAAPRPCLSGRRSCRHPRGRRGSRRLCWVLCSGRGWWKAFVPRGPAGRVSKSRHYL